MSSLKVIQHLPTTLFDEVAVGTDGIPEIFARYGYSSEFAEQCRDNKQFCAEVNARKAELSKSGMLHVHQAVAINSVSGGQLMRMAMDPMTPPAVQLQIYQVTGKMGRLEAPSGAVVAQGPGFSISIHLDGSKRVEKEVKDVREYPTHLEHDDLGPTPEYIMNNELEYKG